MNDLEIDGLEADDPEADDPEADDPEADDPEADDPEADDPEADDLGPEKIEIRVHEIIQPIGPLYFGAMDSKDLVRICYSDIRRVEHEKRDVEAYLGIERPLRRDRVVELEEYVNTVDATFPSSIILSIKGADVRLDKNSGQMFIRGNKCVAKF